MRLISAYVENYGAISKKTIDFDDGLTQICERNGYGKTTLASFIRAMFYGLPGRKVNSTDFNDRERFYPFGGGKFGGSLTFLSSGKKYRIERFFDVKSTVKDTLALYEDGEKVECDDNLGLRFFALDEKTFLRTTFIGEDGEELFDGISVKLSDGSDSEDSVSCERAVEDLDKSIKGYKALRGDSGLIKNLKTKRRDLRTRIADLKGVEKNLSAKYGEKAKFEKLIAEEEDRRVKALRCETERARRANYDKDLAEITTNNAIIDEFRMKYPHGFPSNGEIDAVESCSARIAEKKRLLSDTVLSPAKEYELGELSRTLDGVDLSPETIVSLRGVADEVNRLGVKEESLREELTAIEGDSLVDKFTKSEVDSFEVEELDAKIDRYREVVEKRRVEVENTTDASKKSSRGLAVTLIGAAIVALGAGLAAINVILGGVIAIFGAAIVVGSRVAVNKNRGASRRDEKSGDDDLTVKERLLREEINEFLAKFGYYSRDGILVAYSNFKGDYNRYVAMVDEITEKRGEIVDLENRRKRLETSLDEKLAAYRSSGGDYGATITKLVELGARYSELKRQRDEITSSAAKLRGDIADGEDAVAEFFKRYALNRTESGALGKLREDRLKCAQIKKRNDELSAAVEEFAKSRELEPIVCYDGVSVEDIASEIDVLNKRLVAISGEIASSETLLEELSDDETELDEVEERLTDAEEKHSLLLKTKEYLLKAEKKLKDEYVAPVAAKFAEYAAQVEQSLGVGVDMDKDFRVKFERNGEYRSAKHLSAGQRAVFGLCLRFAVVDTAVKDENPFVIMDDPFVALDEEHLAKVGKVVEKLAENKQIIYFTCHESRKF